MARAVSVVVALKRLGLDRQFSIIPLSAGQAVDIGDTVPTGLEPADDRRRRRIEIRLRRTRE
jgi:hypothetical protein